MSEPLDPLKITTRSLHRFWVQVVSEKEWYNLINECRRLYGRNWRTQKGIRKQFNPIFRTNSHTIFGNFRMAKILLMMDRQTVWFDVPDENWASWVAVKYSVEIVSDLKRRSGK